MSVHATRSTLSGKPESLLRRDAVNDFTKAAGDYTALTFSRSLFFGSYRQDTHTENPIRNRVEMSLATSLRLQLIAQIFLYTKFFDNPGKADNQ